MPRPPSRPVLAGNVIILNTFVCNSLRERPTDRCNDFSRSPYRKRVTSRTLLSSSFQSTRNGGFRMRRFLLLLLVLGLAANSIAAAELSYLDKLPPLIDREVFFGDPEIAGGQISPDGKYISFLKTYKGHLNIWVKAIDEPFDAASPKASSKSRNFLMRKPPFRFDGKVEVRSVPEGTFLYTICRRDRCNQNIPPIPTHPMSPRRPGPVTSYHHGTYAHGRGGPPTGAHRWRGGPFDRSF